MWFKLIKQTGICLILVLTLALVNQVDHPTFNRGCQAVMAQLEKQYTVEDVMAFAKKAASAPAALSNAMISASDQPKYGKPVDLPEKGEVAMIYAVEDGTVSAVGENHKIGKFIKITHGKYSESVYGNCEKIQVQEMEEVRKGQIIASFYNDGTTEFYYSLSKLK